MYILSNIFLNCIILILAFSFFILDESPLLSVVAAVLSFSAVFISFYSSLLFLCSGVSRVTASGDPANSLRATMGTGAPGPSLAPAPERAEGECGPAADSATTHREEVIFL